jgi:hypothetical protein
MPNPASIDNGSGAKSVDRGDASKERGHPANPGSDASEQKRKRGIANSCIQMTSPETIPGNQRTNHDAA